MLTTTIVNLLLFKMACAVRIPATYWCAPACLGLRRRMQIVSGLSRVWFGAVVMPRTAADRWLMEGLAGWLESKIVGPFIGSNELRYRREQERRMVCAADDGVLPPLCPRTGTPGLLGTEVHLQTGTT